MQKYYLHSSLEKANMCFVDTPRYNCQCILNNMSIGQRLEPNNIKYFKTRREAIGVLVKILGRKLNGGEFEDLTNGQFG